VIPANVHGGVGHLLVPRWGASGSCLSFWCWALLENDGFFRSGGRMLRRGAYGLRWLVAALYRADWCYGRDDSVCVIFSF